MAKKKKGGKKGVPEGTPLENYSSHEMNLKELKKYAVKIGSALKETRGERANLEIDRDKMLRNLINVICRLFLMNREVRRLDRELINTKNLCDRKVMDKVNEVAELRIKQATDFHRSKNDLFISGYESVNQLFHKQDQLFKDCIGINNDYYKKYLELEIAFMNNQHISLCDKIDKVNESNLGRLLRKEKSHYRKDAELMEQENQNKAKILKDIVVQKDSIIEDVQKEHFFETVDILRSFEDIIKYNFTVINELRDDLLYIRNNDSKLQREFSELKEKIEVYCSLVQQAQKELIIIRPVVYYLHHTKAAALTFSKKLEMTEEETTNARLEMELLEEFIRNDDECNRQLKQIVVNDLLSFRQMQVKTHLFMMDLGNKIEEMYADRVRIGKLAMFSPEPDWNPLLDLYHRYQCYRLSMVDLVERVLHANFSHLSSLGFHSRTPALPAIRPYRPQPLEKKFSSCRMPTISQVHVQKMSRPRMLELVTSLPSVPMRKTTNHLAHCLRVLKAPIYYRNVRKP